MKIPLDRLQTKPGSHVIQVRSELDGLCGSFGTRFVGALRSGLKEAGFWRPGRLDAISYSDRYVASPLVGRLLVSALSSLAAESAPKGRPTPARLSTQALRPQLDREARRLHHDWRSETDRTSVLQALAKAAGIDLDVQVGPCPHSRRLALQFGEVAVSILLDQGFGFLMPARSPIFDFQGTPQAQARR